MAAPTATISILNTSPPARTMVAGNVVVANTSGAAVHVTSISLTMANMPQLQPAQIDMPPDGTQLVGGGAMPYQITIPNNGSVSFDFQILAFGGTLQCVVGLLESPFELLATASLSPT